MSRLAALSMILAFPAAAQTSVPPIPAPAQAAGKPNPLDRVVCKTEETIGTRLGAHRVCATEREWKEQQEQNQTAAQAMQGVGAGCPEGGSGPGC